MLQGFRATTTPGIFASLSGQLCSRQESIQSTFQLFEKPSPVHLTVSCSHLQGRVTGNDMFCRRPGLIQPDGSVLAEGTTGNQKTPQPVILRGTEFSSEDPIFIPLLSVPRKFPLHVSYRYVSLINERSGFGIFRIY